MLHVIAFTVTVLKAWFLLSAAYTVLALVIQVVVGVAVLVLLGAINRRIWLATFTGSARSARDRRRADVAAVDVSL